jgi:hypothetical protein
LISFEGGGEGERALARLTCSPATPPLSCNIQAGRFVTPRWFIWPALAAADRVSVELSDDIAARKFSASVAERCLRRTRTGGNSTLVNLNSWVMSAKVESAV